MPIFLQVALGMLLAGAIGFVGRLVAVGYLFEAINTSFAQMQEKIMLPRLNRAASYPIETITAKPSDVIAHRGKDLQQRTQRLSQSEPIRNRSEQAYQEAITAVKDFKSQYQKPAECYNMKDDKMRIFCANHFMRARKAYESRKALAVSD
jgi:hypothetical protein